MRRVPGTALAGAGRIVYMPPDTEDRLRTLLTNLERFLHEARDLDPLVRMAAAQHQFEAIHPFTDRNGRTGRLVAVTSEGAWESWLIYVLECVETTATRTTGPVNAIERLATNTAAHVRSRLPRVYSHELVDVLFEQPYCRISNLVDAGIVGRQAASRHLKALCEVGVLREEKRGRDQLFAQPKLMRLLTSDDHAFEPCPDRDEGRA